MSAETERKIQTYHRIHVPHVEHLGAVNVYLADWVSVESRGAMVSFDALGWLWSCGPGGVNAREYFDEPTPMSIPTVRVLEIYYPTEDPDAAPAA